MSTPVFDDTQNIEGKRIVLRTSLNVPVHNGAITNTFRIEQALPTIEALAKKGAQVVVIGHIGREKTNSLKPVYEYFKQHSKVSIRFCEDVIGVRARESVASLGNGEVLLLENVRKEQGEVANDQQFARELAAFGDVFINDAFSASHRAHASIVGIPKHIPGYIGSLFERELRGIAPARTPSSPSLAIIGGAKFVTKEPLLQHLVRTYDRVVIAGALANDFLKAKGFPVGTSLVSDVADVSKLLQNSKVHIPEHIVVENSDGESEEKHVSDVLEHEKIFDVGQQSLTELQPAVGRAKFILWNGPLGYFEGGYTQGTETLARMIADTQAHTVVGGGNTIESIQNLGLNTQFTHVSTSGGAMLQYIADGTLVGIDALSISSNT